MRTCLVVTVEVDSCEAIVPRVAQQRYALHSPQIYRSQGKSRPKIYSLPIEVLLISVCTMAGSRYHALLTVLAAHQS